MSARYADIILGTILLITAILWCWGVIATIPGTGGPGTGGAGTGLGARGFPLGLGVVLGLLGLVVQLGGVLSGRKGKNEAPRRLPLGGELWAIAVVVGFLSLYAVLLQYTGFLIATCLIVAVAVGPVLGHWRPVVIAGMSLGLSLGVYLVLGKVLGVYLPYGRLVNLAL